MIKKGKNKVDSKKENGNEFGEEIGKEKGVSKKQIKNENKILRNLLLGIGFLTETFTVTSSLPR